MSGQDAHRARHNLLNGSGRIRLTPRSPGSGRQPSASRARASRSATLNGHRPAATVTNTSGPAASVQPTGSECCLASSSRKNTRSSAQVWRTATNTNSRPDHGWNGCVTRTIRCAAAGSGVVDDARQRGHRVLALHLGVRAAAGRALRGQGGGPGRGRRLGRGLQRPPPPPGAGPDLPGGVRAVAGREGRRMRAGRPLRGPGPEGGGFAAAHLGQQGCRARAGGRAARGYGAAPQRQGRL